MCGTGSEGLLNICFDIEMLEGDGDGGGDGEGDGKWWILRSERSDIAVL